MTTRGRILMADDVLTFLQVTAALLRQEAASYTPLTALTVFRQCVAALLLPLT